MSYYTYWNPDFYLQVGLFASMEFEVVLTTYGFPTENLAPTVIDNLKEHEDKDVTTINNPIKYT